MVIAIINTSPMPLPVGKFGLVKHVGIGIRGRTIRLVPGLHRFWHPSLKLDNSVLAGRMCVQESKREALLLLRHSGPHLGALSGIEACLRHKLETNLIRLCLALSAEWKLRTV